MGLIKPTLRYWLLSNLYFIIGVNDKLKNCFALRVDFHSFKFSYYMFHHNIILIHHTATLLFIFYLTTLNEFFFLTYHFYVLWKTRKEFTDISERQKISQKEFSFRSWFCAVNALHFGLTGAVSWFLENFFNQKVIYKSIFLLDISYGWPLNA